MKKKLDENKQYLIFMADSRANLEQSVYQWREENDKWVEIEQYLILYIAFWRRDEKKLSLDVLNE